MTDPDREYCSQCGCDVVPCVEDIDCEWICGDCAEELEDDRWFEELDAEWEELTR